MTTHYMLDKPDEPCCTCGETTCKACRLYEQEARDAHFSEMESAIFNIGYSIRHESLYCFRNTDILNDPQEGL